MSSDKRFNIRVYGIWIREGKLLVNEEHIRGQQVVKFPGGGMDWGEGTLECLRREWKEELNLEIEILDHFYTTDYFQHSAYDDSQVVSIYYLVSSHIPPEGLVNSEANERTYWMPLNEVSANTFTLSIDQKVGAMLKILNDTSAL